MISGRIVRCLVFTALLIAGMARAHETDALAELVNEYRSAPRTCDGVRMPMAGALTPSRRLARVRPAPGGDLAQALRQAGYQAARSTTISVSGASRPEELMALLRERHCGALLDPRYSEIGIAREGEAWQLTLAQPLHASGLGDWRDAGQAMLELVNAVRSEPRTCGNVRFDGAPKLAWNERLAQAALEHSRDMARNNYFRHEAGNGATAAERVSRHGYRWQQVGENIAAGQGSPEKVVAGWLASPRHCANIMDPRFTETGAAFATESGSDMIIYWTQVFGTAQPASAER
ncbi:MAG TPA: CAP domain-containing protein [Burkholderiaceae bacterium]|nr:CAP domain-containing protein [Burkholderiaceae bacterium]